jgi:hypothetical protein
LLVGHAYTVAKPEDDGELDNVIDILNGKARKQS